MKKCTFVLLFFLLCPFLFGQSYTNNPLQISNYVPSSPEAAGFAKYGDIPVGEYTGVPDISIPLYTVKSGSLSLPISLSYHASGIQVGQEATWVGLGWNLMAGGCISYMPVGNNNQVLKYIVSWNDREKLLNYVGSEPSEKNEDHLMLWSGVDVGNDSLYQVTDDALFVGLNGNGCPDIYSVNFLNYSFKFFIHPKDNTPIFLGKKNKCIIEMLSLQNILIIGEDGVKYYFSAYETDTEELHYQCWYLTQIVSPDGNYISLSYKNFGAIAALPSLNEKTLFNAPMPGYNSNIIRTVTQNSVYPQYLTSIETSNEKVYFDVDSNRIDISGSGRKLKAIRVLSKLNNTFILKDSLQYSYFSASDIGGDYTNDDDVWKTGYNNPVFSNRLKLTGITRYDLTNTKGGNYCFTYNDSVQLPLKTSFARDYWGYYNGQENNSNLMLNNAKHTLIPNMLDLTLQDGNYTTYSQFLQYSGANRGASAKNITAAILTSIQYPTGGKTIFQFEPNTINQYQSYYPPAEDHYNIFPHISGSVSDNPYVAKNNFQFIIHKQTVVQFAGGINNNNQLYTTSQLLQAGITIVGPIGPNPQTHTYQLSNSDVAQGGKTWTDTISLTPGTYILGCTSQPSTTVYYGYMPIVQATISYDDFNNTALINCTSIGGGVRVKTITNYDNNNNIINTQKYSYRGGQVLSRLRYLKISTLANATCDENELYNFHYFQTAYLLSSDNYSSSSNAYQGTIIGYDTVIVVNTYKNNTTGQVISCFQNNPATYSTVDTYNVANPALSYDYTDGDVLKKIYLNAANDTVRIENNTYSKADVYREVINYLVDDTYIGPTTCVNGYGFNTIAYLGRFMIRTYTNDNYWDCLSNRQTTDYINGNKIVKMDHYIYNPSNYCIKEQTEVNSDNNTHYTWYTYPVDYNIDPYILMQSNNMLTPIIEKSEYVGSNPTCAIKTNYNSFGSNVLGYSLIKPSLIQAKTGTNSYENRIAFNQYDSIGNPIYLTKDSITNIVYLWGYNKTYPVTKIEGATLDQVKLAMGGSIPNLGNSGLSTSQITNLKSQLPNAMVTTYTYFPLIGMATVTDPKGVTTSYTYDTFSRLKDILNDDGNILNDYKYHYSTQQ